MSVLPNDEALLITAYRARSDLTALVGGRISTRLSGTYPAVRVTLIGGASRPTNGTGLPELQVEVWGRGGNPKDEIEASDIARAFEGAVPSLMGSYTQGRICGATTEGYLIHSPDPNGRERYLFTVTLVTQFGDPDDGNVGGLGLQGGFDDGNLP